MSTTPWLQERLKVAEQAADTLAQEFFGADVWLVGALAEGLAHRQSDVDLLLVTPEPVAAPGSRLLGGIRVDVRAETGQTVNEWRRLLDAFAVTREDIATFRTVRERLGDLTLLRTARPLTHVCDEANPCEILLPEQRVTYQRWALADRCEAAASLSEDLLGLAQAGLYPHADLVWDQLARVVAQAETVAAGAPLLGEKWLPSLLSKDDADRFRPVPALPEPRWLSAAAHSPFFASVQARLADALLALWPTNAEPEPVDEAGLGGFGWLPQRYSDGWFLRRGDARVPLTDGQMRAWQHSAARRART
ncbi:nucleotidyltransferase domain-containing protein [Streptomyces sp. SID5789]|uniref:nucleotidyltransferase domain-containing protein n=1 Tax=Streptomyces sp. SID5789 TaxID=2690310 RepID=UPI00136F3501|nr:nucleotidyltransferase domain-containing protein [Streptomyces sp. SID5789]MZE68684.1 hypothetical protein [Streptomyces sp. SID5789]